MSFSGIEPARRYAVAVFANSLKRGWEVVVQRPPRTDYWTAAALLAAQAAMLACAAALSAFLCGQANGENPATLNETSENPGVWGFFAHNSVVFLSWIIGGMVSLGLFTVLFAGFSALYDGLVIGAAAQDRGFAQLLYLGHGLLELPAFAIALYLGLRPFLVLLRLKRGQELGFVREAFSGIALWTSCGLVLLAGAAVWESVVERPL